MNNKSLAQKLEEILGRYEEIVGFEYQNSPSHGYKVDKKTGQEITTINVNYGANRDVVFEPQNFSKELHKEIKKDDKLTEIEKKQILQELDLENLICLIDLPETTSNYSSDNYYDYLLYNKEKQFGVNVSGNMGEFTDDDYDACMDIKIISNYTEEQVNKDVTKMVRGFIKEEVSEMENKFQKLLNATPQNKQDMVKQTLVKNLSKVDMLNTYFAQKQKKLLSSSIKNLSDKKSKVKRKTPKL